MKIRGFFVSVFAAMAALAILLSGWIAAQEVGAYRDAGRSAVLAESIHALSRVMETLRLENGERNQLLSSPAIATPDGLARVAETSAATDEALTRLESLAQSLAQDTQPKVAGPLAKVREQLADARALANDNVRKPSAERADGVTTTFRARMTANASGLQTVLADLEGRLFQIQPDVARMMNTSRLSSELRDVAGQRSSFLSQYVASGRPLSPDAVRQATELTGRVTSAWQSLSTAVRQFENAPNIAAALAETERQSRADVEARYLQLIADAAAGKSPGITSAEWRPWTVSVLRSTLLTRDAAVIDAVDLAKRNQSTAAYNSAIAFGALALVLITFAFVALLFGRRVVNPIIALSDVIGRVAKGEHAAEIPHATRRDEIGRMARAIRSLRDGAAEATAFKIEADREREAATQATRLSLATDFEGQLEGSISTFVEATASIRLSSQTSVGIAGGMRARTETALQDILDLTHRVTSMATASSELAHVTAEISRQATEANRVTTSAALDAQAASSRVAELSTISGRIDDVVNLIRSVADQTNLLALNATIEAARAGEAGRGFAVVASEVKSLAQQTAKATDDIGNQIADMRSAIHQSVEVITRVGDTMPLIAQASAGISAATAQQLSTTEALSVDIAVSAARAEALTGLSESLLSAAADTSSAAQTVLDSITHLDAQCDLISQRTKDFVRTIAA